jgi:hypothetical protein
VRLEPEWLKHMTLMQPNTSGKSLASLGVRGVVLDLTARRIARLHSASKREVAICVYPGDLVAELVLEEIRNVKRKKRKEEKPNKYELFNITGVRLSFPKGRPGL